MAFDVSGISTWNNEVADRSSLLMTAMLGAKTMGIVRKYGGITGENVKVPVFETTAPWQAGAGCGYATSGTTTITQKTITTVPVTIQEKICPNTLLDLFTKQSWVPTGNSTPQTGAMLEWWIQRKLAVTKNKIEQALWQSKTTYTNSTNLKLFNGFLAQIDTAATGIAATQQASISASTVRGIIEEMAYDKIPAAVRDQNPVIFCGYDTFNIYRKKLMVDNLYHSDPTNTALNAYEMAVFGTNVKLVGVPGLNNDNAVEAGALPTAVKNRLIAAAPENLIAAFNVENDMNSFEVWYSPDDRDIKCHMRFYIGVLPVFVPEIVQYTNI